MQSVDVELHDREEQKVLAVRIGTLHIDDAVAKLPFRQIADRDRRQPRLAGKHMRVAPRQQHGIARRQLHPGAVGRLQMGGTGCEKMKTRRFLRGIGGCPWRTGLATPIFHSVEPQAAQNLG
ncbi:hypothetical protein D9M70_537400 [compost metagenome]